MFNESSFTGLAQLQMTRFLWNLVDFLWCADNAFDFCKWRITWQMQVGHCEDEPYDQMNAVLLLLQWGLQIQQNGRRQKWRTERTSLGRPNISQSTLLSVLEQPWRQYAAGTESNQPDDLLHPTIWWPCCRLWFWTMSPHGTGTCILHKEAKTSYGEQRFQLLTIVQQDTMSTTSTQSPRKACIHQQLSYMSQY